MKYSYQRILTDFRTSTTHRFVDKNLTFDFCDKHAGVAEVEFISFSLDKILWHTMCRETTVLQVQVTYLG